VKIAVYVRVSTDKQELKNQLEPLLKYAERQNYEVYKVYKDIGSGKDTNNRAEFNKMMIEAHQRKFDGILVWSLDRLTREGLYKTINLLEHLAKIGISIISYTEPYINTTDELIRNIMLAILSTLAKAERIKISERTKAGLQRAISEGKHVGRPKVPNKVVKKINSLIETSEYSVREIAELCNVSAAFVIKVKKMFTKGVQSLENELTTK